MERQHEEPHKNIQRKHMAAYMLQELTLEDFYDSGLAMRLLNARGRKPPASFARMVDLQRVRKCEAMGV